VGCDELLVCRPSLRGKELAELGPTQGSEHVGDICVVCIIQILEGLVLVGMWWPNHRGSSFRL
jgi:hypothetical protein